MTEVTEFPIDRLPALVESLLFVADGPVTPEQLSQSLGVHTSVIRQTLEGIAGTCDGRGLALQWQAGRVQLVTSPEAAPYIERFLNLELSSRLSAAALETLAIIAYRQPVTRSQMESVRGVNCDSVIRTLQHRGFIESVGRLEQAGRPIVYGTTFEFLQYFGLEDLSELPPLREDRLIELPE